jgi:hypothetical protein
MNVNRLLEVVGKNPFLWLDLTEKRFKEGKYYPTFTARYKDGTVKYNKEPQSDKEMYFNKLVINDMVIETNHLMDYVKSAIKLERELYLEDVTKLIKRYEEFLLKNGIRRDERGYFVAKI